MIDIKKIDIFNCAICSLKEASKDNHDGTDTFMTTSTINVVNFDRVKDEYIKQLSVSEAPASNDALYIDNSGEMFFIEFKSGYMKGKKIFAVRLKIFDSLLILTDIIGEGVSYTRKNLSYILVYNENKNPSGSDDDSEMQLSQSRVDIAKYFLEKKSKEKFIRFGLERFERLYFKDVYTLKESEFENRFVENWS